MESLLTPSKHLVSAVCNSVHFHLHAICHIWPSLTDNMATSIALALIHSHLDYANSLLYGISSTNIHKLQRCQNTTTHLILQQPGTPSVQYLMDQHHWLPVHAWIDFKIATLTYKTLSSGQTAYLRELISSYQPSRSLQSSNQLLLTVPRANLTTGQRAFSYSSPVVWNVQNRL